MTHDARSAVQSPSQYRLAEAIELLRRARDSGLSDQLKKDIRDFLRNRIDERS